jgi:hypothetical protein
VSRSNIRCSNPYELAAGTTPRTPYDYFNSGFMTEILRFVYRTASVDLSLGKQAALPVEDGRLRATVDWANFLLAHRLARSSVRSR